MLSLAGRKSISCSWCTVFVVVLLYIVHYTFISVGVLLLCGYCCCMYAPLIEAFLPRDDSLLIPLCLQAMGTLAEMKADQHHKTKALERRQAAMDESAHLANVHVAKLQQQLEAYKEQSRVAQQLSHSYAAGKSQIYCRPIWFNRLFYVNVAGVVVVIVAVNVARSVALCLNVAVIVVVNVAVSVARSVAELPTTCLSSELVGQG